MSNKVKIHVKASIFILSLLISQNAFSYSGGLSGYSGNPATNAGNTCSSCHSAGIIPSVNLTGPINVQPGSINSYTFTVSGGQQNSAGLDVSVNGGTLINAQAGTRLLAGEITHNQRTTAATDGSVSWGFNWQAPTTPGSYTLYGAGLSTNGDGNTTQDEVATIAYIVTVSSGAPQSPTAVIQAPMSAQINTVVSFDASTSFDSDGTINQYQWRFPGGSTAAGALITHIFDTAGNYTVNLTVTDNDNLTNSTFRDIEVGGLMIPIANPSGSYTGTEGQAINFDASLSNHVVPITRYIWDFGDGTAIAQDGVATMSHTYTKAGTYTLTLAVQDANTITGVANTTVVINAITSPSTGEEIYAIKCAACHGPAGTGGSAENIIGASALKIKKAIQDVIEMQSIPLTNVEAQALSTYLSGNGNGHED